MINSPEVFAFSVERTLPFSNLQPLKTLEIKRLTNAISPHKIDRGNMIKPIDILAQDLVATNEFILFVKAEPFLSSERVESG